MRFTRPSVSRLVLPPGKTEQIVFDESLPGFGIRIRAGGKRTWVAQYRVGRQQRRTTIGSVETVDLEDARRRAKEILAKVQLGGDPQTEKSESRSRAALTLGPVADSYLEAYAADRLKPKTLADTRRYLRVSWKPLHGLPIGKIDRKTVAAHLAEIAKQSGKVTANRARASLSAVFSWAMREGIAEANPVIGTNRAADEVSRDRVLSDDELAAVWKACSDDDYGRIVRLLILTGQRREEVGGVTGSEIDFARARWILPRERTKNGLPHEVPLSGARSSELRRIRALVTSSLAKGVGHSRAGAKRKLRWTEEFVPMAYRSCRGACMISVELPLLAWRNSEFSLTWLRPYSTTSLAIGQELLGSTTEPSTRMRSELPSTLGQLL
jgi:integrase